MRISLPRFGSPSGSRNKIIILAAAVVIIGIVIVQTIIFKDRLPLYATVDGRDLGGWSVVDATKYLDGEYQKSKIDFYAEGASNSLVGVTASDVGIDVDNRARLEGMKSPLWLNIVPSSVLWSHLVVGSSSPNYSVDDQKEEKFITSLVGKDCYIKPVNATLEVKDDKLSIIQSSDGGSCKRSEVEKSIRNIRVDINNSTRASIPITPRSPSIKDSDAERMRQVIEERLDGVAIYAANKEVSIPKGSLLSWLRFSAPDSGIVVSIDPKGSDDFLKKNIAPKVAVVPGVSRVKTRDFVEISRVNGVSGRALNYAKTRDSLAGYLSGLEDRAEAQSNILPPRVEYTRTYSSTDAGLSAMLKHHIEDRSGRIGVSVIELSSKRRRAEHNGSMRFTAASTYKMLLAFSVLKRVEGGQLSWGDQVVGGRNLSRCFDDMIVVSDNDCPQAIIKRIGHSAVQADMRELGFDGTNFLDTENYKTTANDLAKFSAMLEARQLPLSHASHDRLISAMKRNIYRQGIPAGTGGAVANKVGFLGAFLNDAGIVYSSKGTYAVAIMTEKSSWSEIATLVRKIEQFR